MLSDPANRSIYRYSDWAITTPLMLIAILLVIKSSFTIIIGLILLDLVMIGAGHMGAQTKDETIKLWYFLGGYVAFCQFCMCC
jgi:bacteriorhodopsin